MTRILLLNDSPLSGYGDFAANFGSVMSVSYYDSDPGGFLRNVINYKDIDLIMFTGGEDIYPSYYGEKPLFKSDYAQFRDDMEFYALTLAKDAGIPCFGICRGAQLLNIGYGGKLYQHVDGHVDGGHQIETKDGQTFNVTSAHHQMCVVPTDAEVIAWATSPLSKQYRSGSNTPPPDKEPEAILYHGKVDSIGVQFHPEWMKPNSWGFQYATKLVNQLTGE